MRSTMKKILFPATIFALLLVSFLPSVMAQQMNLFGHDLRDTGSWQENIDLMVEIDKATAGTNSPTHLSDTKSLMFDVSYINMGRVQNLYIALKNWTWDLNDAVAQGTGPLQLLIQRYHAVGGRDVIAMNAFTGLVAYRNSENNTYGRPDKNSELYYGWSLYGELLKKYSNDVLGTYFAVAPEDRFNVTEVGIATPIWENSSENSVTFGMSYENLFVFWQEVNIATEPNDTAGTKEAVFGQLDAVCVIKSLNFSYTITTEALAGGNTKVITTTSYEIGAINDLWVREAGVANVTAGGFLHTGTPLGPTIYLGHYNTTDAITTRLNGTDTTHGFSLGVMNYAVILVLDTSEQDDTWDNGTNTVDENANISVSELNLKVAKNAAKAYNIDFGAKPTYVWNGSATPLASPTYIYPKTKINGVITRTLWEAGKWVVNKLWGDNFLGRYRASIDQAYVGDLVYITCFPTWSGLSCVQDPTFTAFTSLQGSFPWYLLVVGLVAVVVVIVIAIRIRHKRHQ